MTHLIILFNHFNKLIWSYFFKHIITLVDHFFCQKFCYFMFIVINYVWHCNGQNFTYNDRHIFIGWYSMSMKLMRKKKKGGITYVLSVFYIQNSYNRHLIIFRFYFTSSLPRTKWRSIDSIETLSRRENMRIASRSRFLAVSLMKKRNIHSLTFKTLNVEFF